MKVYIETKDGRIARIELEDGERDLWDSIQESYPQSYNRIDSVIPGECSGYDAAFDLSDDARLSAWLDECRPEEVTAFKQIRTSGRTLIIYVKEECDQLGIGYGEWVEVTIRKANNRK